MEERINEHVQATVRDLETFIPDSSYLHSHREHIAEGMCVCEAESIVVWNQPACRKRSCNPIYKPASKE